MSQSATIFFVSSLILTGITVLGVPYYIPQEKKLTKILICIYFIKKSVVYRNRIISHHEKQRRLNMKEYEKQLKIKKKLRLSDNLSQKK